MKKLFILFILLCVGLHSFSQEPKNNLRKSVEQLRKDFPDLIKTEDKGNVTSYKSPQADVYFKVTNNKVTNEYMYIFDDNDFLYDLYISLCNSFKKGEDWHRIRTGETYHITKFFYSYFVVKISYYYNNHIAISYALDAYDDDVFDRDKKRRRYRR